MQELLNLKNDFLALEHAVESAIASPSVQGVIDAIGAAGTLLSDIRGAASLFVGPAVMTAAPGEVDGLKGDCRECCDRIKAACAAGASKVGADPAGADPVGRIGDGSLLKLLLDNLPAIISLIDRFFPKK